MPCFSPFAAFGRNKNGSVAIVFALSALPIMALTGLAVDYTAVTRGRSQAISLADSAVLASISQAAGVQDEPVSVALPRAKAMAESQFRTSMGTHERDWSLEKVEVNVEPIESALKVTLCFQALKHTVAMGLMGVATIPFSGCATAQSAPPIYVKVFALIDASGSMGIGASQADQDLMKAKLGCEFACHSLNPPANWGQNCTFRGWWNQRTECVKFIGAKTRFEVVREAMIKVADQAETLSRAPGQYELNVFKFSNYLTTVFDNRTSSLSAARSTLSRMEQDREGSGTNMAYVFPQLAKQLPQSGDGRTRETAKVFVLFLSDGLESNVYERQQCLIDPSYPCGIYAGNWIPDRNFQPYRSWHHYTAFNPALCDVLKKNGVTVLTLYTKYILNGSEYRSDLYPNMKKCASSPEFGFSANSGDEVDRAIRQMFSAVVAKARITR